MLLTPEARRLRARLANASSHNDDPDRIAVLRRDFMAQRLEDYIKRTVEAAPELTSEQRDRLALLLRGGDAA